jgi:hypothetical protein
MRTYPAILFLALLVSVTCFSVPALPAKRRLGMGMSAAQKATFIDVLKDGLNAMKSCAIDELLKYLPSVLQGMGINPEGIIDAIMKFLIHAVESLIGTKRRRRVTVLGKVGGGVKAIANGMVKVGGAYLDGAAAVQGVIVKGVRGAAHGIAAVGSSMKTLAKKLNAMTGGLLEKALSELGCPAIMVAIKAGVFAAFP